MDWSEEIDDVIQNIKPLKKNQVLIQRIISVMDLTRLQDNDTESDIAIFCGKAETDYGNVAGVCVYPEFVRMVAAQFANTPVRTVTVANFPNGTKSLEDVLIELSRALEDGAQEIDVIFPYSRYLEGDEAYARTFVESCKAACGKVVLKVILEVGVLRDPEVIAKASRLSIEAGADFIKTSSGKVSSGATLEAAAAMLLVIRDLQSSYKRPLGFKASGGIKNAQTASQYIELADKILGKENVTPQTFRIGASQLIDDLLNET